MALSVEVGDPIGIGLYAVCNPGETQLFRAADVVFTWDPAYLSLTGLDQAGAVPLLTSTFPVNDVYGLNGPITPPADGDGYYLAWANLGEPVPVTEAGALLTTFQFTALAETAGTLLDIADSGGDPLLATRVLGSEEAGTIVTGTLGSAMITIVPEPAAVALLFVAGLLARRRS